MGHPLKAGANATLTFKQEDYAGLTGIPELALDEAGEPLPYTVAPPTADLVVTAYLIRDNARDTDESPKDKSLQPGPNTEVWPFKGFCISPKKLPGNIRSYSRAHCVLRDSDGRNISGEFVLAWMVQSPWKPVRRALGTRLVGKLLVVGGG
jgi:hypothetical protein